jgi:SAM-dependent methyltransferase
MSEQSPKGSASEANAEADLASAAGRAAKPPRPVSMGPRTGEVAPDSGWTPGAPAVASALAASAVAAAAPEAPAAKPKSEPAKRSKNAIMAMKIVRIESGNSAPLPPPPEPATQPANELPDASDTQEPVIALRQSNRPDDESFEELEDDEVEERVSLPNVDVSSSAGPDSSIASSRPPVSKPPPPRRQRSAGPPAPPSAQAVEKALKAPRFDPSKKRGRLWWEELFTDDFGRAIPPLNAPQVKLEVDFIERSLGVAQEGIVLDLACGTGQHAVELASRGYNVVGYDLSVSQLAEASERAQERGTKINFLQGDMREMAFENTFDGIYCWNTSFGYFEEEKNVHVAKRVFAALKSGGSFLLDVINRDFAVVQQPNQNWFEGDGCICMDDMSVDFITSRMRVKRTVMLDDGRSRECTYSVRIYGLHELGKLLHDIGFKVIQASGHPAVPGVFFGAQSGRVIILAAKP